VIVLQTLHGLSVAETTDALTFELQCEVAVAWPLTARRPKPDADVLASAVAASADPDRIFHAVQTRDRADRCAEGQDPPGVGLHRAR
jgi:hypothetical protein